MNDVMFLVTVERNKNIFGRHDARLSLTSMLGSDIQGFPHCQCYKARVEVLEGLKAFTSPESTRLVDCRIFLISTTCGSHSHFLSSTPKAASAESRPTLPHTGRRRVSSSRSSPAVRLHLPFLVQRESLSTSILTFVNKDTHPGNRPGFLLLKTMPSVLKSHGGHSIIPGKSAICVLIDIFSVRHLLNASCKVPRPVLSEPCTIAAYLDLCQPSPVVRLSIPSRNHS